MRMTFPAMLMFAVSASACDKLQPMPIPEAASAEECAVMKIVAIEGLKLKSRKIAVLDGVTRFDWTPASCDWAAAGLEYRDQMTPGSSYANIGMALTEINFDQPKTTPEGIIVKVSEVSDYDEYLTTCRLTSYQGKYFLNGCTKREITPEDRMGESAAVGDFLMERHGN